MLKKLKNETVVSVYKPVEFPLENNEALEQVLDVVNLAKRQSRNNLPAISSTGPDANELHFKEIIKNKATQARHSVYQAISGLRDQIQLLSVVREKSDIEEMENEFDKRVDAEFSPVLKEIEGLRKSYHQADDDLESFKTQHSIRRAPDYPASHWGTWGALVIALIIESGLNGVFFAEGSDSGLVGGVGLALIISAINIVSGFLLGWWVLRYKNHIVDRMRGLMLTIFVVMSSAIILVFNPLVAHYRGALEVNPDDAAQSAINSFSEGMFSIADVNSWLLLIVGVIFFCLAIYKGYKFDDEYPGYGKLARIKDDFEDDVHNDRENALSEIEELHNDFAEDLEDKYQSALIKETQVNSFSSAFDSQNLILKTYIEHLEGSLQFIIKRYQDTNSIGRDEGVPSYFNDSFDTSMKIEEIDMDYVDKRDLIKNDVEELAKSLTEVRTAMLKIKENYHSKLEEICQS